MIATQSLNLCAPSSLPTSLAVAASASASASVGQQFHRPHISIPNSPMSLAAMIAVQGLHLCLSRSSRRPQPHHVRFRSLRPLAAFRPLRLSGQSISSPSSGAVPYTPHRGKSVSQSQQRMVLCLAALNSKCSAGQTQTVDRQTTSSTISISGPGITPKLEKGGEGGSPPYDGGGGGGGGGGGASSGGFFLFAVLLFLRFLRDLEGEDRKEKREMVMVTEEEEEEEHAPIIMEEDDW